MPSPARLVAALALALLLPTAAHADWDFGEHLWLEGTSGLGTFTGVSKGGVSVTMRSTVGLRLDDTTGLEASLDGAFDPLGGVSAAGGSLMWVLFPETDAVRVRIGSRLRHFAIDPGLMDDLFCYTSCSGLGGEALDLGFELGIASQWNLGPFFFSVEWFGWYQPVFALTADYVYRDGKGGEYRTPADWSGLDLPAEVRFVNLGCGLTF